MEQHHKFWLVRSHGELAIFFPERFPDTFVPLVDSLVRGSCLALSDPDRNRKGSWGGASNGSKGKRHRDGLGTGTRFVLGTSVTIDLREQVREVLSGTRKGGSPKVQFTVRGHWRNQAHGPRHSLRRVQWIQPFWKGPEEARALLRGYKVEEKEEQET